MPQVARDKMRASGMRAYGVEITWKKQIGARLGARPASIIRE